MDGDQSGLLRDILASHRTLLAYIRTALSFAGLGFAVAFGVLLDTLVVRSVLVTALNLDLGRWVWWPSKLYRQSVPEPEQLEEQPSAVS